MSSSKSYHINHATNTATIKDHSFRSCIKQLLLTALVCFIVTVLILCWLKQRPKGIETTVSPTHNYGIFDTRIQDRFNEPDTEKAGIILKSTVSPKFNSHTAQYKSVTRAIQLGSNNDDYNDEDDSMYDDSHNTEIDTIENSTQYLGILKMNIRLNTTNTNQPPGDTITRTTPNVEKIAKHIFTGLNSSTTPVSFFSNTSDVITISTEISKNRTVQVWPTNVQPNLSDSLDEITTEIITEDTTISTGVLANEVTMKLEKKLSMSLPTNAGVNSATTPVTIIENTSDIIQVVPNRAWTTLTNSIEEITTESFTETTTYTDISKVKDEILIVSTTPTNLQQTTKLVNFIAVADPNLTTAIPIATACPEQTVAPTCPMPIPVCETIECKKSASKILSLLNHDSDPCDDFYSFACTGANLNRVDLTSKFYDSDDIYNIDFFKLADSTVPYIQMYKQFYDSCMAYDKEEALPKLQKHIKGINFENVTLTEKRDKLADLIANLLKYGLHGSTAKVIPIPDIVMDIGPDGKFIPVVTIPMEKSLIQEAREENYYEKHCLKLTENLTQEMENVTEIYEIYETCLHNETLYETILQKAINKLSLFGHLSEFDSKQKESKTITVVMWNNVDFITQADKMKDTVDQYSLSDLDVMYPVINWYRLFKAVFNNAQYNFDKIKVRHLDFLKNIFQFYEATEYDEIQSSVLAILAHDLYTEYLDDYGFAGHSNRNMLCTKLTSTALKEVSSKRLINQYSEEQIAFKEKMVEQLFTESKNSFMQSIGNATWMNSVERELLKNKVKSIKIIGKSTEFYKDPVKLIEFYKGLDIQDDFIQNTLSVMKFRRNNMYSLIGKDYLDNQYFWTYLASPLDKKARTIVDIESVVIPFRLLSKSIPMANKMKQKYEIYSTLGYQIAYELAHFFNPRNIKKFWPSQNEDYKNFAAINLIDPYITHIKNPYDLELDKNSIKYTLNARFNDDAAIRMALETYRWESLNTDLPLPWLNFTIPKTFYISFAQQFCNVETNRVKLSVATVESDVLENYFRLNSVIMNSKNFPDEFECNRGTNMNPSLKIEQFPYMNSNAEDEDYEDISDNAN